MARRSFRDTLRDNDDALRRLSALTGKPVPEQWMSNVPDAKPKAPRKASFPDPTNPLEHDMQKAVIAWWGTVHNLYKLPRFALFAIPNGQILMGSARHPERVMAYLHSEGFRDGVPDLMLAVSRREFHGLLIELKRKTGIVSDDQLKFQQYLLDAGYLSCVERHIETAIAMIKHYLGEI